MIGSGVMSKVRTNVSEYLSQELDKSVIKKIQNKEILCEIKR